MSRTFLFASLLSFAGLVLLAANCAAAAELIAAPWPEMKAPKILAGDEREAYILRMQEDMEGILGEAEELASDGDVNMAAWLGYHNYNEDDWEQAATWFRQAVRNGHVPSALMLGRMYFPLGGSLERPSFRLTPDIVTAYAWLAIGLAGAEDWEKLEGGEENPSERDLEEIKKEIAALDLLTLPSERIRVAEILAKWPAELPPESSSASLSGDGEEGDDKEEDDEPGAEVFAKAIEGAATGSIKDMRWLERSSWDKEEDDETLKKAFALLESAAGGGNDKAAYGVAWCRLHGYGTEKSEEGAAFFRERADRGEPEAFLVMGMFVEEGGDKGLPWFEKAAENGNRHAMLMVAGHWREQGDKQKRRLWTERAAVAGSFDAVGEMIGIAESDRDTQGLYKWLTVGILRADNPFVAYRARMMLAYVNNEEAPEELRQGMEAGEKWHAEHPLPKE